MKIKLIIDEQITDTEIEIRTNEYNEEIEQLMQKLQSANSDTIVAYQQNKIHRLKKDDIFSVYAESGHIYFLTDEEEYTSKQKLYEIEELFADSFARVNKSSLVNIDNISYMQMGKIGAMELIMKNDANIHVSRRYLPHLKRHLGIGGKTK